MNDMELIERAEMLMKASAYVPIDDAHQHLLPYIQSEEDWILIVQSIRSLSKDAIDVVELIMNPPEKLSKKLQMKNSKKLTLGKLTDFLREVDPHRWKHSTIKNAFGVIKEVLCS